METVHIFVVIILMGSSVQGIMFWRVYDGTIPADAVLGGYDENNAEIYIGRSLALLNNRYGIAPGTIYPGTTYMDLIMNNTVRIETGIEILCSTSPYGYKWVSTTQETFQTDLLDYAPVRAGIQNAVTNDLLLYSFVARAKYHIGKLVNSDLLLYISEDQKMVKLSSYDVLVHNNP